MRTIVLLSGGLDSAVAMYWAQAQGWDVFPVEYEYFERPERERRACRDLRSRAGITNHISVPVPFLREVTDVASHELNNPALARAPEGYIPLRNLIFYALAGYYAEILGARYVVGGHTRTDCESFPDAGRPFWDQLNQIFRVAIWSHQQIRTEIVLPLITMGKTEVIQLGATLGVPLELTWSCYFNVEQPCGSCASCTERAQALASAGLS
jgi:7-cyano-7-deazaguanine synthase